MDDYFNEALGEAFDIAERNALWCNNAVLWPYGLMFPSCSIRFLIAFTAKEIVSNY